MKFFQVLGILIAISLILFGILYPVPEKYVDVKSGRNAYYSEWSDNYGAEYLGGDAYNYQVEASLKAGYFSGTMTLKSLTFVSGILLFFMSIYSYNSTSLLNRIAAIEDNSTSLLNRIVAIEIQRMEQGLYEGESEQRKIVQNNDDKKNEEA